jgi:two-component system, OmpR family, phosphate regulon sensor histidine kinase PhoR
MTGFEPLLAALAVLSALMAWSWRAQFMAAMRRHARELENQRGERQTELRAQTARTAALFDRMVEGIIVVGLDGRIRLANHAAGNLFGFAPPAIGLTVIEATRQHEVAGLMARLEHDSEILNHELRLEGVSATRFLQANALALRAPDGAGDGAILVFHDLTRIRQLEAVRQEFVANVSHELRTPLSLIKSAAETLLDGGRNDAAITGRFLEIIDQNASRLALLIDDLLLLSKLDSGRVELERANVPLRELVAEAVGDAALLAEGKGVTLKNAVLPGMVAWGDAHRLRQVLANLIDNAVKYGRAEGTVTIDAVAVAGRKVEVCVRDDGPGIPPEARERVFERFYRVDKARSREQGGTGLGLAIVKNVVQAHGGEVRVASEVGRGAAFFFTLPTVAFLPVGETAACA